MIRRTMGYKYGVWIVLNPDDIGHSVKHIPHVTIMCNMAYDKAFHFYQELRWNGYSKIRIAIHRPVVLFPKQYKEDLLDAWGYYVTMHPSKYLLMETMSQKYTGDFSVNPHLSLEYTTTIGKYYQGKGMVEGKVCLADITSDNPSLWKIIS